MKRRRGAPVGNQNAQTHGFYSVAFKASERGLLAQMPSADLSAEIELMRVTNLRFLQALNSAPQPLDLPMQLSALRAVTLSAHSIARLLRAQLLTAQARVDRQELLDSLEDTEPPESTPASRLPDA
jgi:hypothetical protein